MLQAYSHSYRGAEPATEGVGCVLFHWVSNQRLPANRLVRTRPSVAASQTAQPAAFSTTAGEVPVSAPPRFRAGAVNAGKTRANCLRMLEARAIRRAGCGKSARPVRRGEDESRFGF